MAYSADSLNQRVITEMWLHYSSVLSEFLRMVKAAAVNHHQADRLTTENFSVTGCPRHPLVKVFKFLDSVCDDCYDLYRDPDVYSLCRSKCFSSPYFSGCMNMMLLGKSSRSK